MPAPLQSAPMRSRIALEQAAVEGGITVEIVRTGSRGLYWLEPMVELATPQGRIAFGPVTVADAPSVFDAMTSSGPHGCSSASPRKFRG